MTLALLPYPRIDPVLVRLGPVAVRWYGLAYVAAFVGAGLVLRRLNRRWRLGLSEDDELEILLAAVVGVIVGARLGYVLFYNLPSYVKAPLAVFALWDGGMSFHGGLIGIVIAAVVESRRLKLPLLTLCDIGAVGAPIGFFLGRLANFVNDELWGRVTSVPWAMVFPSGGPYPRHPSQLYEAGLEGVVLFAVMWLLSLKVRSRGTEIGWLLLLYGCFRVFAELFRQPDAQITYLPSWVTMGQLLSVPMILAGAWLLIRARTRPTPVQGPRETAER
ncbi:MAG TPA: prolipoprotein diacylglyceryl transferase [Coriobacteriia bacterium]